MRREVPSLTSARRGHGSLESATLINLPPVGEDDEADGVADQAEDGEDGGQDPRDDPPAVFILYALDTDIMREVCRYLDSVEVAPGVVDGAPLLLAELEAAVPGQVEQLEASVVLQQLLHTVRHLSYFFTNIKRF